MTNSYYEDSPAEMPGWIAVTNRFLAIATSKDITEHELFGDQGGYPSIQDGSCFIHEGRRTIPGIHDDDFTERVYQLDGSFILEFEEA
jgi:hypothetical protein